LPVITIALHKVDDLMKANLIKNVTEVAVKTTGVPEQAFTVFIDEHDEMNIGLGGKTYREVKAARGSAK
jgi:4-oxalocrotonate tautomerase family enzyme